MMRRVRGAALAGGADGAEQDRARAPGRGRRRRHDDDGVVAAELEERAAEARAPPTSATRRPIGARAGGARSAARAGRASMRSPTAAPRPMTSAEDARRSRARSSTRVGDAAARRWRSAASPRRLPDHESPQTAASSAFQAHTATGKLKAVMTPTTPERVPLLVHAVAGPLGVHGQAVELAREADGEVADVDHLLHFALALRRRILPISSVTSAPSVVLVRAQRVAELRARPRRAWARAPCATRGIPLAAHQATSS